MFNITQNYKINSNQMQNNFKLKTMNKTLITIVASLAFNLELGIWNLGLGTLTMPE